MICKEYTQEHYSYYGYDCQLFVSLFCGLFQYQPILVVCLQFQLEVFQLFPSPLPPLPTSSPPPATTPSWSSKLLDTPKSSFFIMLFWFSRSVLNILVILLAHTTSYRSRQLRNIVGPKRINIFFSKPVNDFYYLTNNSTQK